jgi:hypothetical protein
MSSTAIKIAMSYINAPSLASVRLKIESLEDIQDSDVSEQVIIDNTNGRKRILDNTAPKIRVWSIKGYIPCEEYEFSSYYMTSLERKKNLLTVAKDTRQPVEFKVRLGKVFQVLIEKMSFSEVASIVNAVPISLTLKEYQTEVVSNVFVDNVAGSSFGSSGTGGGDTANLGGQAGSKIYTSIARKGFNTATETFGISLGAAK